MAEKSLIGLRFFRILMPDCSNKLVIPEVFKGANLRGSAALVSPNGKVWHVDLKLDKRCMFLRGDGWHDFLHANNLELGYLLIFRYRGNMVFGFRAFDQSTSEISFSSSAQVVDRKMKQQQQQMLPSIESSSESECESYEAAGKTQFELTFKAYHARALVIPSSFRKMCGLEKDSSMVCISNERGDTWRVGLKHYGHACIISKGWHCFVPANGLKEGDRLVFELVPSEGRENLIHLRMRKL